MFGANMGTLNVYYQNGTGTRTLAWSRSGDQGNQWNYAEVEIPSVSNLRVNIGILKKMTILIFKFMMLPISPNEI
jgi:hypothetical protein